MWKMGVGNVGKKLLFFYFIKHADLIVEHIGIIM